MAQRIVYHPHPPTRTIFGTLKAWAPSAAFWGAGLGLYAIYFLSVTPIVKGQLVKVPVLGSHFEDKTPPEDKPF